MHGSRVPLLQFAQPSRLFLLGLVLLFAVVSCNSSDDDDGPIFDPGPLPDATEFVSAIAVEGNTASYIDAPFPAGTSSTAPTVLGSNQFVRGAPLGLLITPSDTATELILGVRGSGDGYWTFDLTSVPKLDHGVWYGGSAGHEASAPKAGMPKLTRVVSSKAPGASYLVMVTPLADSQFSGFTLYVSESDGATISRPVRHAAYVNTIAAASDALQVSLNFVHFVDMDLHLETPEGEDIFWAARLSSTGGELDLDSNAGCSIDGVNNENITWVDATPTLGNYTVRVNLWSACDELGPFPYLVTTIVGGVPQIFVGEFTLQDEYAGGSFDGTVITQITLAP